YAGRAADQRLNIVPPDELFFKLRQPHRPEDESGRDREFTAELRFKHSLRSLTVQDLGLEPAETEIDRDNLLDRQLLVPPELQRRVDQSQRRVANRVLLDIESLGQDC